MSKKKKNENLEPEDVFDLNFEEETLSLELEKEKEEKPKQKVDKLQDGTEILRDEVEGDDDEDEDEKEEISDKDLRKLLEFTTGVKANLISDDDLERVRNDEDELERIIKISSIKSKSFNYFPVKNFGVKYKKERQRRNREVKKQRATNFRHIKKSQIAKRN